MPELDPRIPLQANAPAPPQSPLELLGQVQSLRNLGQQNQLQQQQLTAAQLENQQRQRAMGDQSALDQAMSGQFSLDAIVSSLQQQGRGHLIPGIQKAWQDADKAATDAREAKQKVQVAESDYFGRLAMGVKPFLGDPDGGVSAAMLALRHAKEQGYDVTDLASQIQQAPDQLPRLIDSLIAGSEKPAALQQVARGHDLTASGQVETNRHNLTAEEQAAAALAGQNAGRDEAKRHDLEMERAQRENVEGSSLTPESTDKVAEMFATTGQLPPLGMGAAAAKDRRTIINRAAELFPNAAFATNAAVYQANKRSLTNVTGTLDTLSAFESTAGKNLDQFLTLYEKLGDTNSPLLNVPVRTLQGKALGDPNVAAAAAAGSVALREIARVTNDPKLSGALTDSARQEVQGLVPNGATLKQVFAVSKVLKQDMANVHSSLADQRKAIADRIGDGLKDTPQQNTPAAAPAATGTIYARDPKGQLHQAPAGTKLPDGWKQEAH